MDDYTSNILNDSKNEWSILLINYITPHIIDGFKAIFNESIQLCEANDEIEKYLMTFQNLLSRIPKWNQTIVLAEQERIVKSCNCSYLEDLITCVHIIQLKILSCVRVGSETKKITIDIPDISSFVHQIYINIARKLYSNIYLFEIDIPPLEQQRRNREFELIVQTCIMNTIRDKIPVETLLRQFIDETQEIEVTRVEKTLNTTAKALEPIHNSEVRENIMQPQIPQSQMSQSQMQQSQMLQSRMPQSQMPLEKESLQTESNTFSNSRQTQNSNSESNFVQKKTSISFNPQPSILEIENNSNIKIDDFNDSVSNDLESINLSFEDLDSNSSPLKLDFEEL